jgi:hypothetical protein
MTPKEKAEELVNRFLSISVSHYDDMYDGIRDGIRIPLAKKSALIAVDEIIKSNPIFVTSKLEGKDGMHEAYLYWKEVKQELEKL